MAGQPTGTFVTVTTMGEPCRAFIPDPLPPSPLMIDHRLGQRLDEALLALGRLDSVTLLLPEPALFLYAYVRKEAVLSSQIEGTQSSLSDLLRFESNASPGVPVEDVIEVSNYVEALTHGVKRIRGDFPLSQRLLREMHGILLQRGRGAGKVPGEYRRSQNWIGGVRPAEALFVPPPVEHVPDCMAALERFLHDESSLSVVVKIALAHVQFETIHPFLDGNGRLGRLLIPIFFCSHGVLREPMLYMSLYFKRHREEYYALLQAVRDQGAWGDWIGFFADAVTETANQAVDTARTLTRISEEDRERIRNARQTTASALEVHRALRHQPVAAVKTLAALSGLTVNTVGKALDQLGELGIVEEITGKQRDRRYCYRQYLAVLNEGTESRATDD